MLKYINILLLFLSLHVYNVKSENAFYFESTIFPGDNEEYFLHTVERGQTVYGISKIYQVPQDLIYKLNPDSEKGINAGSRLKIPQISGSYVYHTIQPKETLYSVSKKYYMKGEDVKEANPGLSVETFTIGKIIRIPVNKVTKPVEGTDEDKKAAETNALLKSLFSGEKLKVPEVALLLPFEEGDGAQRRRIVEYYEGFLLALDSLKRTGVSVNLHVYDIGTGTVGLTDLLKKEEIKNVHLIIGGVSDAQIKLISGFSKNRNIPYVIPFTSKSDEPMNNSAVFQINTPHSYLYSKVSAAFCDQYKNYKIIFVEDGKNDKIDFVETLREDLKSNGISFQSLQYNADFSRKLSAILDDRNEFVIVPVSGTQELLLKIISPLQIIHQTQKNKRVTLFGYPEWQRYGHEYMNHFYSLQASIYSVFYVDNLNPGVKSFYTKFRKWYGKNPLDSYPKYSILGFDTGMYFIKALNQYGTSMVSNINKVSYSGIQTDFEFERVSNWGGFINTSIYMIGFDPDYTISKKNY